MIWLLGIAVCLFFSAFFSAAEMAFLTTDRVKLRDEAEQGDPRARRLLGLYEDSRQFITSVLIGNNIVNVSATVLLTLYLEGRFGIHNEWVVTAILAPVLVLFGEATPKSYGRLLGRKFLMEHTSLTLFFARLFALPARLLSAASDVFLQPRTPGARKNILVNEDEFRFLIEESVRTGVLEEHEKKLVERILDFERIPVERVFHPVALVPRVELSAKVGEAREEARRTGSKIVLVYEEIPSIVIGMIYVFDLLFEPDKEKGLREYLRAPIFLPRETTLEKAFLALQAKRQSFALVTDPRREVIGVVDIENLIAI